MECNKDEAIKAKEIAVRKFTEKDILGAKKFALKAQNLYPDLDGLSQLLATLDVYISFEKKVNGESDWYGILSLDMFADEDTIKKQYRKLVLNLHPDKNKSIGAEDAFRIISEAWTFLSDKDKKMAYDYKMKSAGLFYKENPTVKSSFQSAGNSISSHSSSPTNPNTFWTACIHCKMQYEYLRNYINLNLLCPNCKQAFLAKEMPPPPINGHIPNPFPSKLHLRKKSFVYHKEARGVGSAVNSFNQTNGQWASHPRSNGSGSVWGADQAGTIQPSKRVSAALGNNGERLVKRRRADELKMTSNKVSTPGGFQKCNSETERIHLAPIIKPSIRTRELSLVELRSMLVNKVSTEIKKKLNGWKEASNKEKKEKEKQKQEIVVNGVKNNDRKFTKVVDLTKKRSYRKKSPHVTILGSNSETKAQNFTTITVPDSDFHDFDMDRTEKSFGENQVWAAYDNDDGMPRFYAMIHRVISLNPFQMKISWLNSKSNHELGRLNWVGAGFTKTSGDFRVGRYEINNSLNSFSHEVKWAKGPRGSIRIFPKKGEVWALYRNWTPNWNELTPDKLIHQYDMVEVMEDFNEEIGSVTVAPLVKISGFKTVFHRHKDPQAVKTFPKEELFRFSHQVPSYLLSGQEAQNAPEGCFELDPAATPLEVTDATSVSPKWEVMDRVIFENSQPFEMGIAMRT